MKWVFREMKRGSISVLCDKRKLGEIRTVSGGWQYWPGGKKAHAGEVYKNLFELKQVVCGSDNLAEETV